MGLKQRRHPAPYKMQWLNDCGALRVNNIVTVQFSIGKYQDQVVCDVVPMQACQLLLGRTWLYDHDVQVSGRENKLAFMYKGECISLLPLTLEEIMMDDLKKKQRESEKHLSENHKHSERVITKPNKTPQPQIAKPRGKEGLVMMTKKGDMKELREPNAKFFVFLYKETLLSTNDLPSTLPSTILISCRAMKMCFPMKYHLGCHPKEALSIKSILFQVLHSPTDHHTAQTRRKPKKFSTKFKTYS